jgi:orotate phosphoribosyltransferase
MPTDAEVDAVLERVGVRSGHFRLESGHHGALWLDLERLCLEPQPVQALAEHLAGHLAAYSFDAVCGPLIEGAFVALMVSNVLNVPFIYTERTATGTDGLFPVKYRVPVSLRSFVGDKRIAIVNDVISAGSAVRGTFEDLQSCGAQVVAIGALAVLGDAAASFAQASQVPLVALAHRPYELWTPEDCPLCASGVPLTTPSDGDSAAHERE